MRTASNLSTVLAINSTVEAAKAAAITAINAAASNAVAAAQAHLSASAKHSDALEKKVETPSPDNLSSRDLSARPLVVAQPSSAPAKLPSFKQFLATKLTVTVSNAPLKEKEKISLDFEQVSSLLECYRKECDDAGYELIGADAKEQAKNNVCVTYPLELQFALAQLELQFARAQEAKSITVAKKKVFLLRVNQEKYQNPPHCFLVMLEKKDSKIEVELWDPAANNSHLIQALKKSYKHPFEFRYSKPEPSLKQKYTFESEYLCALELFSRLGSGIANDCAKVIREGMQKNYDASFRAFCNWVNQMLMPPDILRKNGVLVLNGTFVRRENPDTVAKRLRSALIKAGAKHKLSKLNTIEEGTKEDEADASPIASSPRGLSVQPAVAEESQQETLEDEADASPIASSPRGLSVQPAVAEESQQETLSFGGLIGGLVGGILGSIVGILRCFNPWDSRSLLDILFDTTAAGAKYGSLLGGCRSIFSAKNSGNRSPSQSIRTQQSDVKASDIQTMVPFPSNLKAEQTISRTAAPPSSHPSQLSSPSPGRDATGKVSSSPARSAAHLATIIPGLQFPGPRQ